MIYLGILIFNWLEEIIKKKSIVFPMLCLLYLAWLGGAPDPVTTLDYASYEANYNSMFSLTYNSRFEWAYLSLAKMAYLSGMTYEQFRLILVFGIFIILLVVVRRFTNNMAFFVGTFAMFPFFNEIVQIRSFAMYTLILLAASFLIHVNKRNIIISALIIFLSAGFHSSGYFYFIFIAIRLLMHKHIKINSIIIMVSLISSVALMLTGSTSVGQNIAKIIGILNKNTNATENILSNFVGGGSALTTILSMIALYTLLVILSKKMEVHIYKLTENNSYIAGKVESLMSLIYSGMLSLPLLLISDQYQRFPRFGLETVIIMAALYFEHNIRIFDRLKGMLISLVFVLILSVIFYGIPNSQMAQSIPFLAHLKF
ncbi:EpsG family protein [Weissella koreensis]|uniref:EpsG family protein n=1 Tax=Weissella koreensis TaxID=165096 RepID=UPI000CF3495E|nr:EpsG family protein [Weissella koreensis]AVH74998.1 hypothetical protein C4597_02745 [Weissella koreensis]